MSRRCGPAQRGADAALIRDDTLTFENCDTARRPFTVPQLGISEIFKGSPTDGNDDQAVIHLSWGRHGIVIGRI